LEEARKCPEEIVFQEINSSLDIEFFGNTCHGGQQKMRKRNGYKVAYVCILEQAYQLSFNSDNLMYNDIYIKVS
jgi:hypothetical protein